MISLAVSKDEAHLLVVVVVADGANTTDARMDAPHASPTIVTPPILWGRIGPGTFEPHAMGCFLVRALAPPQKLAAARIPSFVRDFGTLGRWDG